MNCITSEEPANTQFLRAVLMHFVLIEAYESVLRRHGMAWKHGSETGGLSFEIFIPCQTDNVSIKGSLQSRHSRFERPWTSFLDLLQDLYHSSCIFPYHSRSNLLISLVENNWDTGRRLQTFAAMTCLTHRFPKNSAFLNSKLANLAL